ncbi:MAG: hypothetical protein LC772_10015, partial [Chloroflexi bacterium]|nr:hypothetical protein [Chloroflexota bacterium]
MTESSLEPDVCTILDPGHVRWIGVIHQNGGRDVVTLEFGAAAGRVEGRLSIPACGLLNAPLSELSFRSCQIS